MWPFNKNPNLWSLNVRDLEYTAKNQSYFIACHDFPLWIGLSYLCLKSNIHYWWVIGAWPQAGPTARTLAFPPRIKDMLMFIPLVILSFNAGHALTWPFSSLTRWHLKWRGESPEKVRWGEWSRGELSCRHEVNCKVIYNYFYNCMA